MNAMRIEGRYNAYSAGRPVTLFDVRNLTADREGFVFGGTYSAEGHNASPHKCRAAYADWLDNFEEVYGN